MRTGRISPDFAHPRRPIRGPMAKRSFRAGQKAGWRWAHEGQARRPSTSWRQPATCATVRRSRSPSAPSLVNRRMHLPNSHHRVGTRIWSPMIARMGRHRCIAGAGLAAAGAGAAGAVDAGAGPGADGAAGPASASALPLVPCRIPPSACGMLPGASCRTLPGACRIPPGAVGCLPPGVCRIPPGACRMLPDSPRRMLAGAACRRPPGACCIPPGSPCRIPPDACPGAAGGRWGMKRGRGGGRRTGGSASAGAYGRSSGTGSAVVSGGCRHPAGRFLRRSVGNPHSSSD